MSVSAHPLLTVAEVADVLGTGDRFVRRLVAERRIRVYKIGGKVRFAREDVDAFMVASRREVGTVIDPVDLAGPGDVDPDDRPAPPLDTRVVAE